MPIATNEQGQALRLDGDKWVPTQLATNPKTGERMALDGDKWTPLPPAAPKSSGLGDILKSGFQGLKEGTEPGGAMAGGVGDLIGMGMRAVGIPTRDTSKPLPSTVTVPGQYLTPGTVKEDNYQPQTTAGKYARTLGQFAPGLAAGPEGIIPRVASVVAPAVGSEALGQATSGTGAELPARLAGSFIGSGLAGSLQRGTASLANALRGAKPQDAVDAVAPTISDIKSVATSNFDVLKNPETNPIVHKDALARLRDNVKQVLTDEAFHPADEPKTARLFDRIDELHNDHSTLAGLERVRQQATKIGGDFATSDGRMANKVKAEISKFIADLDPEKDIIGTEATGPVKLAGPEAAAQAGPVPGVEELTKARKAWQTMKKASMIEAIVDTADIRGDANYTQAGKDGALRRGFANLAVNQKKMGQFTPQEQDAIKYVAQGGPVQNAARRLGSLAIRGPVSGAATSVLGHMLGPAGPYMLAGAAEAAKAGSAGMTEANVQALQALVRGGPEAQQALSMNNRRALAKALAKYGPAAIGSGAMLTNAGATALANE